MTTWRSIMAIGILTATSAPVFAQGMVDATKPPTVAAAMQTAGYKAVLEKDDFGDPKITSAASGAKFTVFFYGCEQHINCRSLQFFAGYTAKTKPTPQKINDWNIHNRFSTAYLDKDGDPNITWDVVTEGGMPEKLFAGVIERWTDTMGSFQEFIGW